MVTERYIDKLLAPIRRRITGMLTRAVVTGIVEDLQRQNLQLKMHADESGDNIERFQNYGISSYPPAGAEAIVAALGGSLSGLVAIAVEDKKYRPQGESGDVFLYHLDGHKIRLTQAGQIIVTATDVIFEAANSFTIISPETLIQGPLHVTGGISTDLGIYATGAITSGSVVTGSDLSANNISYLGHTHLDAESRPTSAPQ
ncbi:phage baseplate assembly protein V [Shewanella khirikhana]|uniref:Bacteriophage Mu Gp45 protein n=1 Tax=Shewanella khirikhana TaxID=1965282 RepID=A0ABN5TRP2_9GAMM|nr:phage baseplate assembly protein V [Shewanella khirikhana]AZQ10169.1 Bacteriophage Mu Gp45 protein [Shewanella khirikhana]